jgi:hypothetical protein
VIENDELTRKSSLHPEPVLCAGEEHEQKKAKRIRIFLRGEIHGI